MSWETALNRFPLIFSFSASSRSSSCSLTLEVSMLTLTDTASMVAKVRGYPVSVKSSSK